jgi:hypothetical protein
LFLSKREKNILALLLFKQETFTTLAKKDAKKIKSLTEIHVCLLAIEG